ENYVKSMLFYLIKAGEISDKKALVAIVKNGLSEETGENIMTIADQFRAEGIEQGIQQGMQQGMQQGIEIGRMKGRAEGRAEGKAEGKAQAQQDLALRMIQNNFSLHDICQVTELSTTELKKLEVKAKQQASEEEIA